MVRSRFIQIPIYGCKIKVVFTDDVIGYGVGLGLVRDGECLAFTVDDVRYPIVCFDLDAEVGDIAHEVFHIVDGVLGIRGIPLVSGSEEAYAYMIGWLVQEIYKFQLVVINDILK